VNTQKTHIDWLRFRTKAEPLEVLESLKPMFPEHAEFFNLKHQKHGLLGFQQAALICAQDFVIGRMDYGGESQRGWVRVDIPGKGCQWMNVENVSSIQELPSSEIRRVDVALTTWDGEIGHDQVVKAHQEGRFINGGRNPVLKQITSSDERAGRTCYIGKREKSDKFARCYEKGFEMAAQYGRHSHLVTGMDGHPVEGIYRCEAEFKAVNTLISWNAIERRDEYFAGSYPFFADILPGVTPEKFQRKPQAEIQAELAIALENCRTQFGPTLFTALRAYHGDMTAVWDKIVGNHHSQSLLEAGVLLVEHE
jgi:DNA relaxase NicK